MGKSRRNRSAAAHRNDPIAKPIKPPTDPELVALRDAKILPVIKDLQASDPKARSSAATAISNIVQDTKCRKLLLRERVVHIILAQTLTDSELESRAAGWNILELLVQEEDPDFCLHLYRLDVLTAMEYASKSVYDKLLSPEASPSKLSKAELKFQIAITSSLISLLTALVEAQDEILEAVSTRRPLVKLLQGIVMAKDESRDLSTVVTDALACMMTLVEDNVNLAQGVVSPGNGTCIDKLISIQGQSGSNVDSVLACGVLHNIFASLQGSNWDTRGSNASDQMLIPTLANAIKQGLSEHATLNGGGLADPAERQRLALEILASIASSLNPTEAEASNSRKRFTRAKAEGDDQMEDEDGDEEILANDPDPTQDLDPTQDHDQDDHEMDQDEMDADMDLVTGADSVTENSIDDMPVLKTLIQTAIPDLIRIAGSPPDGDAAVMLQSHAMAVLNNLAWSVSVFDFKVEENEAIQSAWIPVSCRIWEKVILPILSSDTADIALATQLTSLAWAIARVSPNKAISQHGVHTKFMTLYQAAQSVEEDPMHPDDPFQDLGVKCVGLLGQLAMDPAPQEVNKVIGSFFMTILSALPETRTAVAVEVLDQIFDIYGDETKPCDVVFKESDFIKCLENIVPKMRASVKSVNRKDQPELRFRADEALTNLVRFLAYRRKLQE